MNTQPSATTTNGPHLRNGERCFRPMAALAACQITQPKKAKSAPIVKWWLKTRALEELTLLLAPKAVTSSKGQHQLPRILGIVISKVEASVHQEPAAVVAPASSPAPAPCVDFQSEHSFASNASFSASTSPASSDLFGTK